MKKKDVRKGVGASPRACPARVKEKANIEY
jgi:hypothetical protein